MSLEKAKKHLSKFGVADKILEFCVSSATVELAAAALNCEPGRIAKTLSFAVNDDTVLIVTAGNMKIDNSKFKHFFQTKAKMLSPDVVEEKIGHKIGGVCPFGVSDNVLVYLDESLKEFETVFPACGSSNSAIELTIPQLYEFSNAKQWIDVCKIKE